MNDYTEVPELAIPEGSAGEHGNGADADGPSRIFDFEGHRREAVDRYQGERASYQEGARAVAAVLRAAFDGGDIKIHTLESRAKTLESFGDKAIRASDADPGSPKYEDPLADITDLAGVRVITFLLEDVDRVSEVIRGEFEVVEKVDKGKLLIEQERLGYHSVHYLVSFTRERCALPEYARFEKLKVEVQVRTILQHAWAEIEHDIQYKAVETIPSLVRRRFMALAGLLEIADREFQEVSKQDEQVRADARSQILAGDLREVEITADSVKAYLDRRLGADKRMSAFSYEWEARVLRRLGFANIEDIDRAISGIDIDRISRVIWGTRQGQLRRLEDALLASLGERVVESHPWGGESWFAESRRAHLRRLREAGLVKADADDS